jgi:uncharacterized protein YbjT (DUF2867 family)
VAVEDVGGVVATIFERRAEFLGRSLYVVGDDRPPADYAAAMARATGKPVTYEHVPREVYASLGFPGAEDLANMFEFYRTRVPNREADLVRSRELYPEIQDFDRWIAKHGERLAASLDAA